MFKSIRSVRAIAAAIFVSLAGGCLASAPRAYAVPTLVCLEVKSESNDAIPGFFANAVYLDSTIVIVDGNTKSPRKVRRLFDTRVVSGGIRRIHVAPSRALLGSFPPDPYWYSVGSDSIVLVDVQMFQSTHIRMRVGRDSANGQRIVHTDDLSSSERPKWEFVQGTFISCQ
jgi:hypothetical protein